WREVSISEMALDRDGRPAPLDTTAVTVGALDPKPRGTLGIVPEQRAPFGCLAVSPAVPRLYCVLGYTQHVGDFRSSTAELAALERTGVKHVARLVDASFYDYQVPYGAWLRAERELKSE